MMDVAEMEERKVRALAFVDADREQFQDGFKPWLDVNWPIWEAFELEANSVWDSGRRHYSASTLMGYIRHETYKRTRGKTEFKINSTFVPDISRIYALMYPERDKFFERRYMQKPQRLRREPLPADAEAVAADRGSLVERGSKRDASSKPPTHVV